LSKEKPPLKIATDSILDPQARWICQRLDAQTRFLHDLLTEVREINRVLKNIESYVLKEPRTKDYDYE